MLAKLSLSKKREQDASQGASQHTEEHVSQPVASAEDASQPGASALQPAADEPPQPCVEPVPLVTLPSNTVKRLGLKRKQAPLLPGMQSKAPKASNSTRASVDDDDDEAGSQKVHSLDELREVNRRALLGNQLGMVRRAPVCEGLTVPKVASAYKAPWRGSPPRNLGLVDPNRRVGKFLGLRRMNMNGGPLASSRPAKMPEQQLIEESEAAPDDKFEPLILWEAPADAPEGTPEKVKS